MSELWDIIQRFMDEDDRSASWVARRIGLSTSGLHKWKKGLTEVPDVTYLSKLEEVTGVRFEDIVAAAGRDALAARERETRPSTRRA